MGQFDNTAMFSLKIDVYKHKNSTGYVYARQIRVDSEPVFLGRSLTVHELRHILKNGLFKLRFTGHKAGSLTYTIVKSKNGSE